MYSSTQGRWLSADPLAGDIANPQSLNRYAYVRNSPTTLVDPTGLCPRTNPDCAGPGRSNSGGFNDAVGSNPPCYVDQFLSPCIVAASLLGMGAAAPCPNNFCSGFAPIGNGAMAFVQFNASLGTYDVINQPFPDPTLAINQINAAYQLGCQYATNPCGINDQVRVCYVGSTYIVQLLNNPLNGSLAAADGYRDPALFNAIFHAGAPASYYIGGDYIGIDPGHVVDLGPAGLEAHYDSFAPYEPFHWFFEAIPSFFFNTRGQAGSGVSYTCSVAVGCH